MRKYESIFILDPDLEDDKALSAVEKIKGIVTQGGGEIIKLEDWGKRKLAYEIKKKPRGHYFLFHFSGTPALLFELERNYRVMDAVIKYQSIRLDERKAVAATAVAPPPEEPEETEAPAPPREPEPKQAEKA
jgi:small subunit ribosomal protein S6